MATKILMPQLGESVTEGTITKWFIKVGDKVKKYDPICEVITDKVNAEVPSSVSGIVTEIIAQEDETIPVGGLICYIQDEESDTSTISTLTNESNFNLDTKREVTIENIDEKNRYSPAVLKLANEHKIDLNKIKGTGLGGRVTRKDVLLYLESGDAANQTPDAIVQTSNIPTTTSKSTSSQNSPIVSIPVVPGDLEIPVTPIRRAIAQRMQISKHEAPHAWTMLEVDVSNLVSYRNRVKEEFKKKEGINLTFLSFFIKAVVDAIKEYPILNSQWAGDKIIQKKEINISIAVATDEALFVPVIKNADEKSILGIARSIDDLARRTREGKLSQGDISGGTFTVNNTGSFGSIQSMPIINYPQAAILSVEAIVKRPVIYNDMIAIRDMVNLCLSLDHRILDGLVCGRFLQSIKQKIESIGTDTQLY